MVEAVNGNFCSRTHRLATIHTLLTTDRRNNSINATITVLTSYDRTKYGEYGRLAIYIAP